MVLAVLAVAVFSFFVLVSGLPVKADAEGFFVGEKGPVEACPGAGVKLVTVDAVTGLLSGRFDPDARDPTIWVRDAAGPLTPVALRVTASKDTLRPRVRAMALAALANAPASETLKAFAESCGAAPEGSAPQPPGDGTGPRSGRSPAPSPRAGLPLEAWAPSECLFVRFRSVEAAYRFADETDRIAAALLASEADDARDYGTLRLVLHDLLLPTIWRTNPDVTRGVGEVGLVVAPPLNRGRLSAAVLFRITDTELHRMQTAAGIADEKSAGHLWRPAGDPFPPERERINFRTIPAEATDLEIVATERGLLDRILSLHSRSVAEQTEFLALRSATVGKDARPEANEALFGWCSLSAVDAWRALVPNLVRSAAREMREGIGLRWLAERWLGGALAPSRLDARADGPSLFASIEAVRVTTDEHGAAISVHCRDAASAAQFADALRRLTTAGPAADRACIHDLRDLVPLALVENPQDDVAERNFVVLGWKPVCPCGGTYTVHPVTREVSCSVHGTAKAPKPGKWTPPPVSGVKAEGSELSFRLAIDWNRQQ